MATRAGKMGRTSDSAPEVKQRTMSKEYESGRTAMLVSGRCRLLRCSWDRGRATRGGTVLINLPSIVLFRALHFFGMANMVRMERNDMIPVSMVPTVSLGCPQLFSKTEMQKRALLHCGGAPWLETAEDKALTPVPAPSFWVHIATPIKPNCSPQGWCLGQ